MEPVTIEIGKFKFHKSFINSYKNLNIVQVRRKLKIWYTKSEQDEIIHYLKENKLIKN